MDSEWQHYKTAGEQAAAQRDFAAAEAMWSMAVLIAEYFGEQDPRLVFSLDNLGHSLLREQKHKLAKQFLGRAWHLKTRVLGLPQKEVARTLNLIAEICFHEGKYSEAEPLSRWVLEVYEQSYGKEDPRTVGAANNLAVLQRIVQQHAQEQAEQQAQQMQAQQMQQPPQQVIDSQQQALQQQLLQAQLQQQQLQAQGQYPGQQAQFNSQQNVQIQAQQQAIQAQQAQFQSQQNTVLAGQQQAVQAQQAQFQSQQNTALSAKEQAQYQAMQQQAQLEAQQQQGQSIKDFEAKQQAYLQQQALLQQAQRDQQQALLQQAQRDQQAQAPIGKVPQRFKVSYCEVCGNKMEAEWCIRCTGTSLKPLGGPLDRLT